MDNARDHHDNPELILKKWKDKTTGRFYLVYVDSYHQELKIGSANEGKGIFKSLGFHPTPVDQKIIMPFETSFANVLPTLDFVGPNGIERIEGDIRPIVDFSVRQIIGGQRFKEIAKAQFDSFPDDAWNKLVEKYPEVPIEMLRTEYSRIMPEYRDKLGYIQTMFDKYDEHIRKISEMECWGIRINKELGEFITGSVPWFGESEGDDFEELRCIRRMYLAISPDLYLAFTDIGWGLRAEEHARFDDEVAFKILRNFNTRILERSDYIISRTLPFIGYEFFSKMKIEIDEFIKNKVE